LLAHLEPEGNGYFSGLCETASAGTLYRYRLDGKGDYPDPASRYQPDGPHGPSCVVDPSTFRWTDADWEGVSIEGQVIYEMHVGTFTREGTWRAAMQELKELADFGITVIEMMPVAEFPGRFGWGYDGVDLFAPTWLYGKPDDLRAFVNEAHRHKLAVILDVVYNHFGPDGNYWREYSESYFTDRYINEWGDAINFDGPDAGPVREFILANAAYWVKEFHMDGLRIDATQQMFDSSENHIVGEIVKAVRTAAGRRKTIVVGENEPQHARLARPPERNGYGLDALWNDDFHHSAIVATTGRREAYYTDYLGTPQEFVSMIKWGFLYQGQYYSWQRKARGTPCLDLDPAQFILFLQNHDQVANTLRGLRLHKLTSMGRYRAMTALLLLAPGTPMLFQGQEFAASAPFLYFADQKPELSKKVRDGRYEFLSQFPSLNNEQARLAIPDPGNPATFEESKLDLSERVTHREIYVLHKDLLRLRREDEVFRKQKRGMVDGAVLSDQAFLLRWFGGNGNDRLLLVNLGRDLSLRHALDPLLAPPEGRKWEVLWSSEDCRYGGMGTPPLKTTTTWSIPGEAAIALTATIKEELKPSHG